jgi:hypothetical protein
MSNKLEKRKTRHTLEISGFAKAVAKRATERKLGMNSFDMLQMLDADARPFFSNEALRLNVAVSNDELDSSDRLLSEVFDYCGLDPRKPFDWRVLLVAMAEVGFKRAGRSLIWSKFRYLELLDDIRSLQARQPSLTGYSAIAAKLLQKEPYRTKYKISKKGLEKDYLRKRVKKALDPKSNIFAGMRSGEAYGSFVGRHDDGSESIERAHRADLPT